MMLPGDLKVVGPEVDTARLKAHLSGVFPRLAILGGAVVVFGSGGARKVPEGFDPKKARAQYLQAVVIASEEAVKHGLVIAVEPLNTGETNLINSVAEGLAIVREAARPGARLLADFFHMRKEKEPYGAIVEAGALMAHAHIARLEGRLIPQDAAEDEYGKFFAALKAAGYQGRVSVEGKIENLPDQAPAALKLLRKLARP
jgi:sugar phosphate isomerase/epimerase